MRGDDENSGSFFGYRDLEARVRPEHPLRPLREIANAALATLSHRSHPRRGNRRFSRGIGAAPMAYSAFACLAGCGLGYPCRWSLRR